MPYETTSAGGIIVSGGGRIAVVGQITGSSSLPKGHVELGESLLQGAVREIREEVGLVVGEPLKRYPAYSRPSGSRPDEVKQIVMFLFAIDDEPELVPIDPANSDARWLTPVGAVDTLTYPEDRDFLMSALADFTPGSSGNPPHRGEFR